MKVVPICMTAVIAAAITGWSWSHGSGEDTVVPVQSQKLSDVPGKRVVMATLSYEPGGASAPHLHPGSVFAYVLQGVVVSQLEGQPPITYNAGESWYEAPNTPHLVTRNASQTRPAKLLAVFVQDVNGAITVRLVSPRQ